MNKGRPSGHIDSPLSKEQYDGLGGFRGRFQTSCVQTDLLYGMSIVKLLMHG